MAVIETVARELMSSGEEVPWLAVLQRLGESLGASRGCVILDEPADGAGAHLILHAEWPVADSALPRAASHPMVFPVDSESPDWLRMLAGGGIVHAASAELPASARGSLVQHENGTVLAVPLVATGSFTGFIAVEHARSPSPWSEVDIDLLRVAGSLACEAIAAKQTERLTRDHGELMRAVLSASPDSYYLLDSKGTILAANENGARRFGLAVKDLTGRAIESLMTPEVEQARRPYFEKVLRTGRPVRFIDQREDLHLDNTMYPVLDGRGHVRRVVVSSHNISEIKRAEQAITESEYRYRALFEHAPVSLIVRDAGDRIVDANTAAARELGFSLDELIGGSPLKYERATEGELAARSRRVLEGAVLDYDTELVRPDGGTFHARVAETRVPLPDGSTGVLAISHDITRRKLDEETIRRSELKYRGFFEAAQDAMFLVDSATLSIIESNDAACRLYGYSVEELLTMTFECLSAMPGETRSTLADRVSYVPMRQHRRKDGSPFPVEISFSYYSQNGRELCSAVVRDQTEKMKSFEEQAKSMSRLQQVQKLSSLNVMAGGIAHNFNNILHVVIGYTELAMAQMPDHTMPRTYVERSNRAARQAAELSNLMLAYVGQGKMGYKTIEINALVDNMKPVLSSLLSKLAIVEYHLEPQLPSLTADANQLKQVMIGLATNASESLEGEPGTITITTRQARCNREYLAETYLDEHLPEGDYICLEVADTGSGMDQETLGRIFDPFFTTKFSGRGLGLAAVLGIVRGHRGAIRVRSAPGKGSSFQLLLPLAGQSDLVTPPPQG